jgi:tetratricopeptide (TPR) repeat protein
MDNDNINDLKDVLFHNYKNVKSSKIQEANSNKTANEYLQSGISKKNTLDYDGALMDFVKATEFNPDCTEAYFNKAIIHSELKNFILALSNFNIVIDLDGTNVEAYYYCGVIMVNMEDYQGAIDSFSDAIYLNTNYIDAYINRAFSKVQLLDWRGAIVDYTKIIELNPNYSDAYYNRGVAKHSLREYIDAIDDLSIAIKLNPNDKVANELLEKSTKLMELEKLMNLQSDNNNNISAEDYFNRGPSKYTLQDHHGAIADFTKAIELNPTFKSKIEEEIEKKSLLHENKQNSIEIEWLQTTESIYHDNGSIEFQLDTLYTDDSLSIFLNTETTKNANTIIENLINLNGGFSNFKKEIRNGYELFYVGNKFSISWRFSIVGLIQVDIISRVSNDFDEFNTMNVEFDAYYYNIAKTDYLNHEAYINYDNDDFLDGIDSVKKALEIIPDDSSFIDTLALGYYYLGDYKLAIQTSNNCIDIDIDKCTENEEHYTTRAKINIKLNHIKNAIEDLKKALELDPDFEEAIKLLESLK